MAALNLVYDLDKANSSSNISNNLASDIKRIDDKVTEALQSLETNQRFLATD